MCETPGEPDTHHLWRNRRTWWVAFTIVLDGYRQERIRQSLGTRDLEVARERRDALLREYAARPHVQVTVRPPHRPQPAGILPIASEGC